jgi:outer membrane protein
MILGMVRCLRPCLLALFFSPALLAAEGPTNAPKSLTEAYAAALKRSEAFGVQQELLVQADELEKQAKAALLPVITGSGTFLHQPSPNNTTGGALYPNQQNLVKISGDQPLFRGFRDFAALRQRGELTGQQTFQVQNAAKQLFYDTSTAFFNVLMNTQDVANYENEIAVNQKRVKELEEFYRIGRSKVSDLLTFKANVAAIESALEASRTQLESSKDVLAFETGWPRETPIADTEPSPAGPVDVQNYLVHIDERPDVKAAISGLAANAEGVPIARGAHLPSLDLLGNYYFTRPGALSDVNWDVSLVVTVPIFQGGAIQSQVRQAESVEREYSLLLSQARRTAEEEVRTFHDSWVGDQRQLNKLAETASLGKANYEAQLKDYRHGLVTNLDVLQAVTTYMDAARGRDRGTYLVKLDSIKLSVAVGARPELFHVYQQTQPQN